MESSFTGLNRPERDHLSLYTIGSGFGESSVLVLPRDNAARAPVIVADTCMDGDVHLTLELLEELKLSHIDLLLVTHSDLDHVRGLPALLGEVKIAEVWRFPGAADVRTLASKWLRGNPRDQRLSELAKAMLRLDELADANACAEACADTRSWQPAERAPVTITCLAPSQHDQRRSRAALDRLVRMEARGPKRFARHPAVAAIVIDRGRGLKARDQRKQPAAGMVQVVHCDCGPDRVIGALSPASDNEAAINPDDLPSHIR